MGRLLDRSDSLLLIVDAQPSFYGHGQERRAAAMRGPLDRIAWLAGVAAACGVPVVATEEDADRNGSTADAIAAALPAGTPVFAKSVFGAADQPDILAAIKATGRGTAVVVGLETDVCVTHTILGLLDRGYQAFVVADATYAPGATHDAGLRRVADAGAVVIHAKGVYYEWFRTLEAARDFERDHPELAEPPGFSL